ASVFVDIKKIRLLWANGYSDLEIRGALKLKWTKWKRRLRIMRAVPIDEDTFSSYKTYFLEHQKYKARMERSLRRLKVIHAWASKMSEVVARGGSVYQAPRDADHALNTLVEINKVNEMIRNSEAQLLIVKKNLGLMEEGETESAVFSARNVREAWKRRVDRAKDITPVV
ncbi:hypothetical protein LCGC14_2286780, partial [marine sediment metagenome]